MEPSDVSELNPKTHMPDTLTVLQPGERVICTVRRHPIGILTVYAMCSLFIFITAILAFAVAPGLFSGAGERQLLAAGILAIVIVSAACVTIALITTKVYWDNSWILTTDSLTQVRRISLFRRHSSQLSLESVEDVSSEQNGILPRLFNYGLLRVETAAERNKFLFPFCPNPNYYATQILSAREAFELHGHNRQDPIDQPSQPKLAEAGPEIASYEVPGGPDGSV